MYFLVTALYSGKHLVLGLQIYMDFILLIIIVLLLLLHKDIMLFNSMKVFNIHMKVYRNDTEQLKERKYLAAECLN